MRNRFVLGMCLLPALASAKDAIWLGNGDRIAGDIVFKNDDRLVVDTDYAGRITIDWTKVATLETDKPITVVIKGVDGAAHSKLDVFENGTVICKQCKTPIVALKDIDTLVSPTPLGDSFRSEGHADVAAVFDRKDSDSDQYNLDGELRLYHGDWRHVIDGSREQKKEDDDTSKDKWDASYSIDRFFGEHLYVRTTAAYSKDYVEDIFRNRTYSAGPGYLFWDDKLRRLDVTLEYGHIHLWIYDADLDVGAELQFNATQLSWDFSHALFGDRVSVYMKGSVAVPDYEPVSRIAENEVGLRYKVSGWLSAKIGYEVDEIKTELGDARYYQTRLGLGANW